MGILPRKISSLRRTRSGLSLIEVLVVIVIIAILILISIWSYRVQLLKGRDARRKSDLNRLETVFEDFYNDHNCYPKTVDEIVPDYVSAFPTDPVTSEPYGFSTGGCDTYQIYADLEWEQDPAIAEAGCGDGCGPGGGTSEVSCDYNYGVCSPNSTLESCASCSNSCQGAACNVLDRDQWDCPQWFCSSNCDGNCPNPDYHCKKL